MTEKLPPSPGTGVKPPVNKTEAKNPSAEVDPSNIVPITLDRLTAEQRDELEQMMSNVKNKFMDSFQETRRETIPMRSARVHLKVTKVLQLAQVTKVTFLKMWADLEKQLHSYFYSGIHEMKLSDLTAIKQRHDESVQDYIQRFREMRNRCYSLSLTDSQLADLAFQVLIAPIKEKFSAQDFESLSHLAQKVTLHEQRFAEAKKNFKKINHVYPYMCDSDDEDDDSEVAAAEWVKRKKVIPCQWVKSSGKEERFDFDITKADKIFDILLREKQIQLPAGHIIPSAEELGKRRYCKWHNSGSHSTNDCKVFRQQIQAAIEGGKIKFDDSKKPMKVDGNPFLVNMVHTSERAADGGSNRKFQVNSARIISKYQRKYDRQQGEYHEEDGGFDPHWDCEFFRFCWNEGMRLPSIEDCPGCSNAGNSSRSYSRAEFEAKQADVDDVEEASAKVVLSPEQAIFEKPEGIENRHLKPLYINGFANGKPMSKMMVDGGAAVNLMPYATFRKLGRNPNDLIKTNMVLKDFGGNPSETKGVLNVELTVGSPGDRPRPTFISKNLSSEFRTKLIELLKEYRDCFAWEYYEMPGLSRSVVEHRLPIKPGIRPYQQPPRRCKADMLEVVKAEVKHLYDAGFIHPCRYAEWVSNIVPVIKKNGKVRVYIDDEVVISKEIEDHIADLRKVFERTRKYGLKMNPTKCAFGKLEPFTPLLRLKADQKFTWGAEQQKALDNIKKYLSSPPVLIPPQKGISFRLYLSAGDKSIGSVLIQELERKERAIFYLSRRLLDAETRYSPVEKLCLCLYFSCTKLRHYLLSNECTVICKADVVKYMLSAPILKGRVGKWIFALTEFDLRYESPKTIKGQAIADFIMDHRDDSIGSVDIVPWTLFFDGSVCTHGCGIGLVIISPRGASFEFAYTIKPYVTNNQAEYEAVLKGLQLLKEVEADAIEIMGDSLLVISQLAGEYECKNDTLMVYNEKCRELMSGFRLVTLKHVSREQNVEANDLAQGASGYKPMLKDVEIEVATITADDWRYVVFQYLQNPSQSASRKLCYKALKYTLLDDELYYRTIHGVLLKYLSADQAMVVMGEIPPYKLVYGHEAVLPWEVRIGSRRTYLQDELTTDEYYNLMADEREDLVQSRLRALAKVTKDKERVARHYNKKVVPKSFSEGELVWKLILPIGTRDNKFGKWSPNWEGPFQIHKVVSKGAYMLKGLVGKVYGRALNGKYLKKYYPNVWVNL
uniref:Retrotransposon protein, putative, unclassified n=1 Tax=Oryza sativa subsp. japonica TaxID=39947 RepID=Q10KH4_ORYSJ|nr:retrotransposon protein, putative, unclassified [Oryza sativa Japonica Group]